MFRRIESHPVSRIIIMWGPKRLANRDEKIPHVKVLTESRINECHMVQVKIEDTKTIPSPSEIMSQSIDLYDSLDARRSPWTLSQVFQSWRATIVSSPDLWSSILLDMVGDLNDPLSSICAQFSCLESILKGHGTHPSPYGFAVPSTLQIIPFFPSFPPSLPVSKIYSFYAIVFVPCKAFPGPTSRIHDGFDYAGNLRVFEGEMLQPLVIPFIAWSHLAHLMFPVYGTQDLDLLLQAKCMKSLEINDMGIKIPDGHETISLPHLTCMTLRRNSAILSSLSIPNLTVIILVYKRTPPVQTDFGVAPITIPFLSRHFRMVLVLFLLLQLSSVLFPDSPSDIGQDLHVTFSIKIYLPFVAFHESATFLSLSCDTLHADDASKSSSQICVKTLDRAHSCMSEPRPSWLFWEPLSDLARMSMSIFPPDRPPAKGYIFISASATFVSPNFLPYGALPSIDTSQPPGARRRNDFVAKLTKRKGLRMDIKVFQELPKVYSSPRARAIPRFPNNDYGKRHPQDEEELLDSITSYVQSCDRTFFGTTGQSGFIHISPAAKHTLVLPETVS
ncbi:uncharacterized protein BT62DRAFT_1013680 [Guyanagaster necrorhizus]|uniref:F-box domain-containing protein n=1 Tax=Guyanagaster necrorhizus TaxID=856835 RepID=A0A9P8ALE5_9AGAR|nr:uncharacterized protein BT62DRAFT_1013680 [Guyanagaster necrorhizus MCA 3950]KAG7439639.1 hypothetical protein BT62DRAFT_1013680 [Guyanagaster necrorhizus MCA 3950]